MTPPNAALPALVAKWRESANGGSRYSTTPYEDGCTAELRRCADELEAALLAEPGEAVPIGSVLIDRNGEAWDFQPRVREFFGAIIEDDAYIHDTEDVARRDRHSAGVAPFRAALVYTHPAAPAGVSEADIARVLDVQPFTAANDARRVWQLFHENVHVGDALRSIAKALQEPRKP